MSASRPLTRRELYDLVWSKPANELAVDFGISDVGLAKICDRYRVPKPGRGYWAKIQAGHKVTKALVREVNDPALNRIEIRSGLRESSPAAREVIEKAKADRRVVNPASRKHVAPVPFTPPGDVHAAIKRTAQALRQAKPDAHGAVQAIGDGLCGVDVAAANVERVLAFLDALTRKLEAKSLALEPTGKAMRVTVGLDSATFTLAERTRREKHVPTPEGLAAEERRQKKLQRYWQSPRSWNDERSSLFRQAYPEFDVVYTGALVFQIEGYSEGVRRTWGDGKRQTVEALLDDITVGLEAVLAVRKSRREEQEERERRWQGRARRRELARKRAEREERRTSYLNSIINVHNEIRCLRQWLAEVEAVSQSSVPSGLAQLVGWTQQRLAKLKTTVDPLHIDQDLKEKGLFPETDELRDPEGDPPDEPYFW